MTFTRLKCTPLRLILHLDDLGRKILFHFNLAFKVEPFQLVHPKWRSFLKDFLCLGCLWCIYLHCLSFGKHDKQYGTNFWEGEHFHVHTTLEPFNSHNIILK